MNPKNFAQEHYALKTVVTANEEAITKAIADGTVKPEMSLREIGEVTGIDNPQVVRHYLLKFLKADTEVEKK